MESPSARLSFQNLKPANSTMGRYYEQALEVAGWISLALPGLQHGSRSASRSTEQNVNGIDPSAHQRRS
jgi:hypothetical protein